MKQNKNDHPHPYMENLAKFNGKIIEVKDVFGETIRGTCIAIYKPHLNVIIETKDSVFIIKNPMTVRRDKDLVRTIPKTDEERQERYEKLKKLNDALEKEVKEKEVKEKEVKEKEVKEEPIKKKRGRPKKK